jgi:DNA-binding beta-propeller fold protein YncE
MRQVGFGNFVYEEVREWGQFPADWAFEDCPGVAVDSQDRVYAFTRETTGMVVFDPDGAFLGSWGRDLFKRPHGIFIGPDDAIYCADDWGQSIRKFTTDGELLMEIETKDHPADTGYVWGSQPSAIRRAGPPFNFPTWVTLSSEGDLYVTDGYGNARVHKFTADGELLFSWGEPGDGPGQFVTPHSVCVDKNGIVYVADRQNLRIQVFNSRGEFINQWSDVHWPCDMCIDPEENIYVAEVGGVFMSTGKVPNHDNPSARVTVRNLNGEILSEWGEADPLGEGRYFAPHSIAIDSQGSLYIGEVSTSYTGGTAPADWRAFRKFVRI